MENILNQKPGDDFLHRLSFSSSFVEDEDIKGKKILDIGCGFGWFELDALRRGANDIVGIEISEKDLVTAKNYVAKNGVSFHVGNALNLPFKDKTFDTVICWEIIEHIPKNSENKMFSEVKRVLKDNGVLYLSAPYKHIISNIFDPTWWLIGHRHYSYDDLCYFAQNNNFKKEKYFIKGGLWSILGLWDLYISKWIFKRRIFFERFINKKINYEMDKPKGFTNIFFKCRAT